jgi:hypothetical protein
VDPDPHWIRIQKFGGSGSGLRKNAGSRLNQSGSTTLLSFKLINTGIWIAILYPDDGAVIIQIKGTPGDTGAASIRNIPVPLTNKQTGYTRH